MENDILNLDQACTFLGVGERTVIKMLREEHMPARKIGREWRFSKSALINWVASGDSYEYANKDELYEVVKDTSDNYSILLDSILDAVSDIKVNRNISTLLKDVPEGIDIPDNVTLRVSYKQKREIEKLDFKLFWPLREEHKLTSKEKQL
ncbi:helix-turn-helix domain-containing protein [Hespellia stercorisuis]|uniref:DNA binding domain-containing protein, excisionase family n=1 Tax=Hespellia stercorisuis DSM 15480 TaxID=1121950 RepID=A0A1M6I7X8_9FIRM|nr:helix-turn-helix domain-containing protein [Hespellia stercorisuis]SHJ30550.1 DNA binding domain-containing protein, excisionase family [Hespellia stercorisuis DSM 15480]